MGHRVGNLVLQGCVSGAVKVISVHISYIIPPLPILAQNIS